MPLSDSKVRSATATDRRQLIPCGNAMYLVVEPISKGGGKSFMGRTRFPPGRKGKQGHYRSSPNSTQRDNYSTYGNTNPYTGQRGTKRCGLYDGC